MSSLQHIVIPGQIIASSNQSTSTNDEGSSFLRGHGTYIEIDMTQQSNSSSHNNNNPQQTIPEDEEEYESNYHHHPAENLVASVAGTIERVNKLHTVHPLNSSFVAQPGDPVVGRIVSIQANKWKVSLSSTTFGGKLASLPLTGMILPDGMQRMRTAADALSMRFVLDEGDVVSAEVKNVQSVGSTTVASSTMNSASGGASNNTTSTSTGSGGMIVLHARSVRCGKLENGCLVHVPSWLIGRRKKHFVILGKGPNINLINNSNGAGLEGEEEDGFEGVQVEVLLGCNGGIWIQRAMTELDNATATGETPLPEVVQAIRAKHARTTPTGHERMVIARVRNAIEALRMVKCRITPENIEKVVKTSGADLKVQVKDMLRPDVIVQITACTRKSIK